MHQWWRIAGARRQNAPVEQIGGQNSFSLLLLTYCPSLVTMWLPGRFGALLLSWCSPYCSVPLWLLDAILALGALLATQRPPRCTAHFWPLGTHLVCSCLVVSALLNIGILLTTTCFPDCMASSLLLVSLLSA